MQWYYVENESPRGPVEAEQLEGLAASGALKPQALVWREGMENWEPFQAVAARGELRASVAAGAFAQAAPVPQAAPPAPGAAMPAAAGDQVSYCSACGRRLPLSAMHMHGAQVLCAACYEQAYARGAMGGAAVAPQYGSPYGAPYATPYAAAGAMNYAGFWIRFVALIIDWIVIGIISYPLRNFFRIEGLDRIQPGDIDAMMRFWHPIFALFFWRVMMSRIYHAVFVWLAAGSPGKLILGLKVLRSDGSRVGLLRAFARSFSYLISIAPFGVGCIMAAFHSEKCALHDLICDTRVVHKP